MITDSHREEKVRDSGSNVIETDNPQKLREFRDLVLTKMSRFWNNPLEIKIAILETMSEFSRREDLIGWIPGNEAIDVGALAEEIARLTKENASLREQVARFDNASPFNSQEEIELRYIYEKLNRELEISGEVYEHIFKDGQFNNSRFIQRYIVKISLLDLLFSYARTKMIYSKHEIDSYLSDEKKFDSQFFKVLENNNQIFSLNSPNLTTEVYSHGLLEPQSETSSRGTVGYVYFFSSKMRRFLFWADFNRLVNEDFSIEFAPIEIKEVKVED